MTAPCGIKDKVCIWCQGYQYCEWTKNKVAGDSTGRSMKMEVDFIPLFVTKK